MSDPSGVSPGEIGGVFAGVVALLVAVGKGVGWLLNWNDARALTRSAKLDAWHRELAEREAKLDADTATYQARIEKRLAAVEDENYALRVAFDLVAAPLRKLDPDNDGLKKAEQLLAAAFPLVPRVPADMKDALGKLE